MDVTTLETDSSIVFSTHFHPEVRDSEYKRLLRLPPREPWSEALLERAVWARQWSAGHARPWFFARRAPVTNAANGQFCIEGVHFRSRDVESRIRTASEVVLAAASAGGEIVQEAQRLWSTDEPDRYYFLECYAAAIVEALISEARNRLRQWAAARDRSLLPRYSPGYPGWNIGEQPALLRVLTRGGNLPLPGPLEVLPSGMPNPRASQLALFAVSNTHDPKATDAEDVACRHCAWMACDLRREQFVTANK